MNLIAFTGFKGCGKTTAALGLVSGYGFEILSFAKPLKDAAQIIFGLTDEQLLDRTLKETVDPRWNLTPRQILQQLGTEVGRQFSPDIWIKSLETKIKPDGKYVIDDCRFMNEANWVRTMAGVVVGIERKATDKFDGHASEADIAHRWSELCDFVITNDAEICDLHLCMKPFLNWE